MKQYIVDAFTDKVFAGKERIFKAGHITSPAKQRHVILDALRGFALLGEGNTFLALSEVARTLREHGASRKGRNHQDQFHQMKAI